MRTPTSPRAFVVAGLAAAAILAAALQPPVPVAARIDGEAALVRSAGLGAPSPTPTPGTPEPSPTAPPTPKPTPTPAPTPRPLEERAAEAEARADACGDAACRRAELEPIFREAWPHDGAPEDHAVEDVIPCESEPDWERTSKGAAGELGLLQIHPRWHRERWTRMGYSDEDMYHVVPNADVGASIYAESGWGPWTCG